MVLSVFAGGIAFSGTAAAAAGNASSTALVDNAGADAGTEVANNGNNGNSPLPVEVAGDEMLAAFNANDYSSSDNLTVVNTYVGEGVRVSTDSTVSVGGQSWYVAPLSAAKEDGQTKVEYYYNGTLIDTEDYETAKYDLQVTPDELIHGNTVTLEGSIYKYPGDLANDQTFGYSVYFNDNNTSPGDSEVSSSDVNDGTFVTRKTFNDYDDKALSDYPDDSGAGPSYEIYLGTNATNPPAPGDANVGQDSIDTRLQLSDFGTDPSTVVYNTSADVSGTFSNYSAPVRGYDLELKDPNQTTAKSTSTASDGSYAFTAVFDDAGEWNIATNEGGVISYQPIQVQAQDANLTFRATSEQVKNFPTDYQVVVRDNATGDVLDLSDADTADTVYDGYVNITGPFAAPDDGDLTDDGNTSIIRQGDANASDNQIEYIHVTTDATADGVAFTATPLGSAITATLENTPADTNPGVEREDDAADTPDAPDYAATETLFSGATGPVNILDQQIYDDGYGTDILEDNGPSVIEVLPLAQNAGERIQNGYRLGFDGNRNLGGMSTYYIQFEVRDEENQPILPADFNNKDGRIKNITISGLESDGIAVNTSGGGVSFSANNGIVLPGQSTYGDLDGDQRPEFQFAFRPQEAVEQDETVDITVNVNGEDPVTYSVDATGLNISEFRIDGETVTSVETSTTPDLTAVLNAPYDNGAPVNNGRIRLTKTVAGQPGLNQDLNQTDARVSNVNDGQYSFDNVQVGPRGVDTNNDGIADTTADLTFTGYQYVDADNNGAADLERDEVDRGALETLDIAPKSMNIAFDNSTSKYVDHRTNGFGEPAFTLTQGVEYEQIAFHLTYDNGSAVDLTNGLNGMDVGLNDLAESGLISLSGPSQEGIPQNAQVLFDESASNASAGYYVITDISAGYWIHTDADGTPDADDLNQDGVFAFDNGYGPTRGTDTYRLTVENPARTHSSAENASTGYIDVMQPNVDTDIIGVNTQQMGVPQHTLQDNFQSTDEVENVTTDIGRWYRVNATLTDTFGTPIDGEAFANTFIDDAMGYADSDNANVAFLSTLGNNLNNGGLEVNNASGSFQFDIQPTSADVNGDFDAAYYTEIHNISAGQWVSGQYAVGLPSSTFEDSPLGTRPVVNVYDQSGARLPIAGDTGNQILANDVTQTLRVEAFPSDPDDLPLPGRTYQFNTAVDPIAENTVTTDTNLRGSDILVTDDYRNISYDQGQIGFLTLTPTGTGDGIIRLLDNGGLQVQDEDGDNIVFDVNRSNKQVDLELSSQAVTTGGTLTVTVTEDATDRPIELTEVSLSDPNGNVVATNVTNSDGEAVFNIAGDADRGTYTVETRPAGFEPFETNVDVVRAAEVTIEDQTSDGSTVTVESAYLRDGGFIVIHNSSGSVLGNSEYLEAGGHTSIEITLDQPISENQTLTAMAHMDDGNELYDFPDSDGPYTVGGTPVTDDAQITVEDSGTVTLPDQDAPATDLNGDGLLEDVDGNGEGQIADVIVFFNERDSAAVTNNPDLFDFDGNGEAGNIGDVIALFNVISA